MKQELKELLVGILLGDGHIKRMKPNHAFITFEQSTTKSNYIEHVFNTVKEEGLLLKKENLTEYIRYDRRYDSTNKSLYFKSENLTELRELADLFLDENGNKVIPTNIANHLSPRSLAFWIMDDGQRVKNGGVTLCTDSFKEPEIVLLREALKSNFDIESTIHNKKLKSGVCQRIYITKESLDKTKEDIIPYFDDSMLYKVHVKPSFKQDTSDYLIDSLDVSDNPLGLFEE